MGKGRRSLPNNGSAHSAVPVLRSVEARKYTSYFWSGDTSSGPVKSIFFQNELFQAASVARLGVDVEARPFAPLVFFNAPSRWVESPQRR